MSSRKQVQRLIRALSSPRVRRRANAAFRLGLLRDAEAIGPLQEALEDKNLRVRALVAWALASIRGHPVGHLGELIMDEAGGLDMVGLQITFDSLQSLLRDEESGEIEGP